MCDDVINGKHGEINALIALEGSKAATSILMRSWHPHRYEGSHIQKKIKSCTTVILHAISILPNLIKSILTMKQLELVQTSNN